MYKNGYNSFRVFKCGHAFLNINLISGFFDRLKDPKRTLETVFSQCVICTDKNTWDHKENKRLSMYGLGTVFDTGTILRPRMVMPEDFFCLGALAHELKVGDVLDVAGYRGTNLLIYEGKHQYLQVNTEEYWPIWPLQYLRLRGYLYYLNFMERFDALLFGNEVCLYSYSEKFKDDEKFKDEKDGKWFCPFKNAKHANELLANSTATTFSAPISHKERIVLKDGKIHIVGNNGQDLCLNPCGSLAAYPTFSLSPHEE